MDCPACGLLVALAGSPGVSHGSLTTGQEGRDPICPWDLNRSPDVPAGAGNYERQTVCGVVLLGRLPFPLSALISDSWDTWPGGSWGGAPLAQSPHRRLREVGRVLGCRLTVPFWEDSMVTITSCG